MYKQNGKRSQRLKERGWIIGRDGTLQRGKKIRQGSGRWTKPGMLAQGKKSEKQSISIQDRILLVCDSTETDAATIRAMVQARQGSSVDGLTITAALDALISDGSLEKGKAALSFRLSEEGKQCQKRLLGSFR